MRAIKNFIEAILPGMRSRRGMSLLEVMVAIALFSLVILAAVEIFISFLNSSDRTRAETEVNYNLRLAHLRIADEAKKATSIIIPGSPAGSSTSAQGEMIRLSTGAGSVCGDAGITCFFWSAANRLQIRVGIDPAVDLTSQAVAITAMSVTRVENGTRHSLVVSTTMRYSGTGSVSYEKTLKSSYALR